MRVKFKPVPRAGPPRNVAKTDTNTHTRVFAGIVTQIRWLPNRALFWAAGKSARGSLTYNPQFLKARAASRWGRVKNKSRIFPRGGGGIPRGSSVYLPNNALKDWWNAQNREEGAWELSPSSFPKIRWRTEPFGQKKKSSSAFLASPSE